MLVSEASIHFVVAPEFCEFCVVTSLYLRWFLVLGNWGLYCLRVYPCSLLPRWYGWTASLICIAHDKIFHHLNRSREVLLCNVGISSWGIVLFWQVFFYVVCFHGDSGYGEWVAVVHFSFECVFESVGFCIYRADAVSRTWLCNLLRLVALRFSLSAVLRLYSVQQQGSRPGMHFPRLVARKLCSYWAVSPSVDPRWFHSRLLECLPFLLLSGMIANSVVPRWVRCQMSAEDFRVILGLQDRAVDFYSRLAFVLLRLMGWKTCLSTFLVTLPFGVAVGTRIAAPGKLIFL